MRELKFRAWDKKFSVMLMDIMPYQPSIVLSDVMFNGCYGDKADERSEKGVDDGGPEHYCITDEEIEIMQYTGLKDKNGVEIYEGDIVAAKQRNKGTIQIGSIEMPKSCWVLQFTNELGKLRWHRTAEFSELEIIGNIYANPELITTNA